MFLGALAAIALTVGGTAFVYDVANTESNTSAHAQLEQFQSQAPQVASLTTVEAADRL